MEWPFKVQNENCQQFQQANYTHKELWSAFKFSYTPKSSVNGLKSLTYDRCTPFSRACMISFDCRSGNLTYSLSLASLACLRTRSFFCFVLFWRECYLTHVPEFHLLPSLRWYEVTADNPDAGFLKASCMCSVTYILYINM